LKDYFQEGADGSDIRHTVAVCRGAIDGFGTCESAQGLIDVIKMYMK